MANILNIPNYLGDQTNPLVLNQMASQASKPPPGWRAPMLPPGQEQSPWVNAGQAPEQAPPEQEAQPDAATPPPQGPPPSLYAQNHPQLDYANMLLRLQGVGRPISEEEKEGRRNMDTAFAEKMAKQQTDVNGLRDTVNKYSSTPDRFDFRPLAAFVDSMNPGSNFSKTAQEMAPESPEQKTAKMAELQKTVAAAQAGITNDQYEYIKAKLQQMGYDASRATKGEIAQLAAAGKLAGVEAQGAKTAIQTGMQDKRLSLQQQRLGQQIDKEARAAGNNDAMLKQYAPRLEGAAKIGELIDSAGNGKVVSNQALLGQVNAEIARLETGSQSPGLGASEKTELQDRKAQLQSYVDSFTGSPSDAVRPEVLATGKKLVNELSGSYMKGIDSRMAYLKGGMTPGQAEIIDKKHQSLKDTYSPRFGGWHGLNEVGQGAPPVDADLTKMSPKQLQDYVNAHGK